MSKNKLPKLVQDFIAKMERENSPTAAEINKAIQARLEKMDDETRKVFKELAEEVERSLGREGFSTKFSTAEEQVEEARLSKVPKVPFPKELAEQLGQYVKGQDHARRTVAIGVYQHYLRHQNPEIGGKSNILLAGPTGCGKTEMARALGRILDVPVHIADATGLTAHGYVGKDTDSILLGLLAACDYDREKAETGIVFIDEIDKKSKKTSTTGGPDVGGESVQQALLKMIEGAEVEIEQASPGMGKRSFKIDTSKILFIVGGAFVGLEKAIADRMYTGKTAYGHSASEVDFVEPSIALLPKLLPEDFSKFGIIPELIGRLPVLAALHALDENHMLEILKETHDSVNIVSENKRLFKEFGVELQFEEKALQHVAAYAVKQSKVGARGLRGAIHRLIEDASFELPGSAKKRFRVTESLAQEKLVIDATTSQKK